MYVSCLVFDGFSLFAFKYYICPRHSCPLIIHLLRTPGYGILHLVSSTLLPYGTTQSMQRLNFFSKPRTSMADAGYHSDRRKVIQYVDFADDKDADGHGTHVAGIAAGKVRATARRFAPLAIQ